jgi:DnaJ-domain-containing protein 1
LIKWPAVRQQLRASGESSKDAGKAWLAINAALLQPTAGKAWRAAFEAAETARCEAAVERLRAFRESPAGQQQQSYAQRIIDQLLMRPYLGLPGPREILGVGQNATPQQIKKAYRTLAQKWHPDREGGDAEQFIRIQEAYEMLKVFT